MPDFEVELTELQQASMRLADGGNIVLSAWSGTGEADVPDIPPPVSVIPRSDGNGHYTMPKLHALDSAFGRELGFVGVVRAYDEYRTLLESQLRTLGDHTIDLAEALGQVVERYRTADQWRG
ncbi:hypothetical protein DMH03_24165 [Amycolatopsis sp. WAC 01376]|uniref:hypothetical protein n=1 Tax=Amycolatopsis sp. WAC 01376 TaxID=2203195 RepID=UPI000F7A3EF9|nr:hypothetical protein [Amycolatopsis sp. WAC 01376]RSM58992.1 hypothetical protein DMH03_24165 [Amycolatopsis sp. WAC 01376]